MVGGSFVAARVVASAVWRTRSGRCRSAGVLSVWPHVSLHCSHCLLAFAVPVGSRLLLPPSDDVGASRSCVPGVVDGSAASCFGDRLLHLRRWLSIRRAPSSCRNRWWSVVVAVRRLVSSACCVASACCRCRNPWCGSTPLWVVSRCCRC